MENHKDVMEVSVTAYGKTITVTQPDDVDMHEFLAMCKTLATGIGYDEDSWKDAVIDMGDEYTIREMTSHRNHML